MTTLFLAIWELLSRGRAFRGSLLAITFVESIHASGRVNQLLLAGEKRVASRADFNVQVAFFGRTRLKSFAAGAGNSDLAILWMNLWFHCSLDPHYRQLNALFSKQTMIGFKPGNVKLAAVPQTVSLG